jgi:hypothetical protein
MPDELVKPEVMRQRIRTFQEILLDQVQADIPVFQYFSAGVYLRRIDIPAGTLLAGRIHKYPCLSIVVSGVADVVTEQGQLHIVAPMVFESPAGVKRAIRAVTDCIWITAHPNPENIELEPDGMAEVYTVDTYTELEHFRQLEHKPCHS